MHRLREITSMKNIDKHNVYMSERDEQKEDALRKAAVVGDDVDKSIYANFMSEKVKRDGAYGNFYRKKPEPKVHERMNF